MLQLGNAAHRHGSADLIEQVEPAPQNGVQSGDLSVLPLNAHEIKNLFYERKIDIIEATNLLTKWRYYPIFSINEISNLKIKKVKYYYALLSKRGNKKSCKKIYNNKTIKPLFDLCKKYDKKPRLIDKDNKTHFLKLTLTVKISECSLYEWNSKRCAEEVILFKKRLRARFGQNLQFARADEVNYNGYIHVNLIVFSPTYEFIVFKHTSRHWTHPGRVTWRIGTKQGDKELKNEINQMWIDKDTEENNVDIIALETCHDLIEYALKYQIKFFNKSLSSKKREWTLGILTLFKKRSISISKQFTEGVVNYVEELNRLDTLMSKCPKKQNLSIFDEKEKQIDENIKVRHKGVVSGYTLKEHGYDINQTCIVSDEPPPNIRHKSNKISNDFSHFPTLNESLLDLKKFHCIQTIDELENIVNESANEDFISIDTETTGIDYLTDSLVGISCAFGNGKSYYIPIGHRNENINFNKAKPLIQKILAQDNIKIFHNYKYDLAILQRHGFEVYHDVFDTLIATHIHDSSKKFVSLDTLAKNLLNYEMQQYSDIVGKDQSFQDIDITKAAGYSCEDALVTLQLGCLLFKLIKLSEVEQSFKRDMELIPITLDMEVAGIRIDTKKAEKLSEDYEIDIQNLKEAIFQVTGHEFNINSNKQLRELLFEDFNLPIKGTTPTGVPSVGKYTLKYLSTINQIPNLILKYRQLYNLKNNFIDKLPSVSINGSIHTQFNLTSASTGRFTSSKPNMQNVPKRTTDVIRSLFIPRDENYIFVRADYSQVELRMAAHLSQDPLMIQAYSNNDDIHSLTASKIFNVDIEKITPYQREIGKTTNFRLLYGGGAAKFAQDINFSIENANVSTKDAAKYKSDFFKTYEKLNPYFNKIINEARSCGYLVTEFGTRRRFFNLEFLVGDEVDSDCRRARNFIIQGTCADILKIAMIQIYKEFKSKNLKSKLILTVHDELVFDVFKPELNQAVAIIKKYMESAASLSVPLDADISIRKNWAEEVDHEQ